MIERLQRLLTRARSREGCFWTRRKWWKEGLQEHADKPVPVRHALAFRNVLLNIEVAIQPDEILVGLHPSSPLPPEETVPPGPRVDPQDAHRLPEERAALKSGFFTSANKRDHLTADYPRLLADGIDAFLARIPDSESEYTEAQRAEWRAMRIALESFSDYIERYAVLAHEMATVEADPRRQDELTTIADVCLRIAHERPQTLRDALQLAWFAFLASCIENGESTGAFAVGRFDQYLWPFWQTDRDAGVPREALVEQVGCFWVKLNEFVARGLAPAVLNMTIGGSLVDGGDGVNDLSFACLELMDDFRTVTPSLSVRWHPDIDQTFFRKAVELSTKGFGQPAFYGDPGIIKAMENAGVAPVDAINVVPGGCVELGIMGCCHPWVGNFFNLPKCLEMALFNGRDPRTGEQLGPETGTPDQLRTFDDIFNAFQQQVEYFLELMIHSDCTTDRLAGQHSPLPFLSSIVADCLDVGIDISRGGARYNFTEIQGIGIANVVDSLLNMKRLVYEDGAKPFSEILDALRQNFEDAESFSQQLRSMRPVYGDNTSETSDMAKAVVHTFYERCEGRPNPRGGTFRPGLLVWTLHTGWANTVGALPDGRRAGEPFASSIGPRTEVKIGTPTTVLSDATAFDHTRCAGGLTLNLRFDRGSTSTSAGIKAVMGLLETYFRKGGLQLQINVIDSAVLREAQEHPEAYPDLLVRVSGFCARFNDLPHDLQNEVIARNELPSC